MKSKQKDKLSTVIRVQLNERAHYISPLSVYPRHLVHRIPLISTGISDAEQSWRESPGSERSIAPIKRHFRRYKSNARSFYCFGYVRVVITDGYTSASPIGWLVNRDRPVHDLSRKKIRFFKWKLSKDRRKIFKRKNFPGGYIIKGFYAKFLEATWNF